MTVEIIIRNNDGTIVSKDLMNARNESTKSFAHGGGIALSDSEFLFGYSWRPHVSYRKLITESLEKEIK